MSIYASYNPERTEEFTRMLDELVDLLEAYYYDENPNPILNKETKIYEYASDYLPSFVPDLDRFFSVIHQALRNGVPPEDSDVDAHLASIHDHIQRLNGYADLYRYCSDEYSRHSKETSITSYHDRNKSKIVRELLGAFTLPELPDNTEAIEETREIIRSSVTEGFADRKKQRIHDVLAYLEQQDQPRSVAEMQTSNVKASWPLIRLLLSKKKIIRYTGDRFLLPNKLQISKSEKEDLIQAVENCFILDRVLNSFEIYRNVSPQFGSLFQRLHIESAYSMFSVFAAILPDSFEYKQPKIALRGEKIPEPKDNIIRFLKNKYQTRVLDLKEYIDMMEYEIPINMQTLTEIPGFYLSNRETLIPANRVKLTEDQKKTIVKLIVQELEEREDSDGEALAIRNLRCLIHFPPIDLPWDEWLLFCLIQEFHSPELHVTYTSARYSISIPIVSLYPTVSYQTRKRIMDDLKGMEYDSSKLKIFKSENIDDLFDEELEEEWLMEDLDDLNEDDEEE